MSRTKIASLPLHSNRTLKEIIFWCEEQELRLTPLRARILELVWKSKQPLKAYDILKLLSKRSAIAQAPTVYRTLDFLLEHHLIHKVEHLNAFIACAHPDKKHAPKFLICFHCNHVQEWFSSSLIENMNRTIRRKGFYPTHHTVEISGLCKPCATKPNVRTQK